MLLEIERIVGAAHVLRPQGDELASFERDWRGRVRGKALAVVRPGSPQEVADVVKLCAQHRVPIVAQGGNTGLVVGGVPDDSGTQLVLSLTRLSRIRNIDTANSSIAVDAGCVLQTIQNAAKDAGMLFPLSLAAQGSCTIGGNLATNAGGTQVLRFGNARDLCLGLEFVNAQGDIVSTGSGLRKDNTGYDLRHLLIGSEGTLGVITGAVMRLYPQPKAVCTAWVGLPDLRSAVALLSFAQAELGAALTGFEVMGQFALKLTQAQFPERRQALSPDAHAFVALLDMSDSESEQHARQRFEAVLGHALEAGWAHDAAIAETLGQSQAMWHVRESIPLAQAQAGLNIKHDISLPISRIADFCDSTDALLQAAVPGMRLVNFGHLGDGNLHYNVQCPSGVESAAFLATHEKRINSLVYAQVAEHEGSISAEHGIGSLKRDALPEYKSSAALAVMRQIKLAMDPLGILNPGRVLVV